MTSAKKLLSLLKRAGMSQEELAEKLNVSRQAVSRWEMGTAMPDAQNLLELSKIFGVSVDYLLKEELGESEQKVEKEEPAKPPSETPQATVSPPKPKYDTLNILCILLSVFHGILFANELGIGFRFIILNIAAVPYKTMASIVPYLILAFFTLLHGVNIVGFEIGCRFYKNNPSAKEKRRQFYRVSVWFFAFSPDVLVMSMFQSITEIPAILFVTIAAAIYFAVCGTVTFLLRKRKSS